MALTNFARAVEVITGGASGIGRGGAVDTCTASKMQTMLNINFMGVYHCVQVALPAMRQQQSGPFVFLSSVAVKFGVPLLSAYCASKLAVRGFFSALRAELHRTGIGITNVYRARVDTPMVLQEENSQNMMDVEMLLTPEKVASEILQAVSEDRRDLTIAPNPDIAFILRVYKDDPDRAEMQLGEAYLRRATRAAEHHATQGTQQ
ncbi:MAG TPA: SDR family NAD(P)-dependent oxidoreductase [Ktedonobacteraceae bacterium]